MEGWIDLLRSLGQSLLAVLRAEAAALGVDVQRSASHLGRGAAFIAAAVGVLFWTLGIVVLTLIAVLALWLPVWAAALIVALLFAGTAGLLLWLAWRELQKLSNPFEDLRRRIDDHLDWWQNRLLATPVAVGEGAVTAASAGSAASAAPAPPARPRGAGDATPPPPRIHPDDPLEEDDL